MALLPTCLMYRQVLFKNGLQRKQPCCRSLRFQSIPVNWNLMRCGILSGQKNKRWIHKAVLVKQAKPLPGLSVVVMLIPFRRLFDKVKHLNDCQYYTDNWEAFAKVLPAERHHIGNQGQRQSNVITAIHAIILDDSHAAPK